MTVEIGNIKLYTLQEISEKFNNVSVASLRTYIRQEKLKGRKIGQKWYVTEDALKDFFAPTWGSSCNKAITNAKK